MKNNPNNGKPQSWEAEWERKGGGGEAGKGGSSN